MALLPNIMMPDRLEWLNLNQTALKHAWRCNMTITIKMRISDGKLFSLLWFVFCFRSTAKKASALFRVNWLHGSWKHMILSRLEEGRRNCIFSEWCTCVQHKILSVMDWIPPIPQYGFNFLPHFDTLTTSNITRIHTENLRHHSNIITTGRLCACLYRNL